MIFLSFLISACRCGILNSRSVPPVNAPASVLPTFCEQTSIPRPWQQSVSDGSGQINRTGIPKPEIRWNDMNMREISWNESLLRFHGVLGYGWFNGSIFSPQKKRWFFLTNMHTSIDWPKVDIHRAGGQITTSTLPDRNRKISTNPCLNWCQFKCIVQYPSMIIWWSPIISIIGVSFNDHLRSAMIPNDPQWPVKFQVILHDVSCSAEALLSTFGSPLSNKKEHWAFTGCPSMSFLWNWCLTMSHWHNAFFQEASEGKELFPFLQERICLLRWCRVAFPIATHDEFASVQIGDAWTL